MFGVYIYFWDEHETPEIILHTIYVHILKSTESIDSSKYRPVIVKSIDTLIGTLSSHGVIKYVKNLRIRRLPCGADT